MLIFIPDRTGSNQTHLSEAGLKHLLRPDDDSPSSTDLISTGPGGLYGQTWGWLGDGGEANGYIPEGQHWIPNDGGRYWVGWQYDRLPSPATLVRKSVLPGKPVELGDGQLWLIPSAMELPQQAKLRNGQWTWLPESRFEEFVERSQWAFDLVCKWLENPGPVPIEAVDYAIEVLSMNYRLTPEIVDHLGLITPINLMQILANSTDLKRLVEIQAELKKAEPAVTPSG